MPVPVPVPVCTVELALDYGVHTVSQVAVALPIFIDGAMEGGKTYSQGITLT